MADAAKGLPLSYSNDGVHPNKAGYQVMELLVENAISLILS
jgi:lysophospholipase L1-like esterase